MTGVQTCALPICGGILNNKLVVEQIKAEIRKYLEENDNDETNPAILWDALKAVIRGKLISITSRLKKEKETQYKSLLADLKQLEQKHKEKTDKKIERQMKEVRNQINRILQQEMKGSVYFSLRFSNLNFLL